MGVTNIQLQRFATRPKYRNQHHCTYNNPFTYSVFICSFTCICKIGEYKRMREPGFTLMIIICILTSGFLFLLFWLLNTDNCFNGNFSARYANRMRWQKYRFQWTKIAFFWYILLTPSVTLVKSKNECKLRNERLFYKFSKP